MASVSTQPSPERATYRSGFFFGTLTFVAVAALGVVSTILTARIYGVRIVGQYALVWAPVAALWVLSTVKEQQAMIKELTGLKPRDPRVTQLFAAVLTFSGLFTMLASALAAVACWLVFRGPLHASGLLTPAFVNIAGYALFMNTGWNFDSILSAFVAGRQIFWVRLHEVLGFIVIAVVVGVMWRSVWGLVIAIVGASLSTLVHRVIVTRRFLRLRLTRAEYREGLRSLPDLLRFGLRATPGAIAQGVSQQGGVWALGTVAPIAVVGAYSRAQVVPQRLQQATNRISEVLYPTLVDRHTRGDGEGFDRALVDSIRYEVIGMLAIGAALGGCARTVLQIFGPGFQSATTALALLAVFPALASITMTQTQALWATDRPGVTSLIAFGRLVVTLGLLVALTPPLGISGPAIALLAGYVVSAVLSGVALRRSMSSALRASWPVHERLALTVSYGVGFLAGHAVERASLGIIGLPLELSAGLAAYVATLLVLRGLNVRDRERLAQGRLWLQGRRAHPPAPIVEATACAE